jgi:hypothetical protein
MFIIVQSTQFSIDTQYAVHCYYMFRPTVAIIKYTEPLHSPLLLSAIPSYTGQCLHIGGVL